MKILAVVDIHGDMEIIQKIVKTVKKENIGAVVCAGDISMFGRDLKKLVKELSKAECAVMIVHGNHESIGEMESAVKNLKNTMFIHEKAVEVMDYVFVGYGGGGFATTDKDFKQLINTFKERFKDKKVVFVLHGPPYNTKVDKIHGQQVGNKTYREMIERYQPVLAICGHLHETANMEDKIGKTKVINPGWEGKILDI